MIRRILLTLVVVGLPVTVWMVSRSAPTTKLDAALPMQVQVAPTACGYRYTVTPGREALRGLRWIGGQEPGYLITQVVTQSDRQELLVYRDHQRQHHLALTRPAAIPDGAWRLMELGYGLAVDDQHWAFAFTLPEAAGQVAGWMVLVDPRRPQELTTLPLPYRHLTSRVLGGTVHVVLWDDKGGCQRILWKPGTAPRSEAIALPDGIVQPVALHVDASGHLWVGSGQQLWLHTNAVWQPLLEPFEQGFLKFPAARPRFAAWGQEIWFQPTPGHCFQRTNEAGFQRVALSPEGSEAQDGALLQLLGCDREGRPWFDLALPQVPGLRPSGTAEGERRGEDAQWSAYLAQPLDRLYCLNPRTQSWKQWSLGSLWQSCNLPGPAPQDAAAVSLPAGWLLAGEPQALNVIPLTGLPSSIGVPQPR